MTVSFLEWDSNFFNRAVAKIDIDENEVVNISQIIEDCKKAHYKMLYIFVNSRNAGMKAKAAALLGTAINEKIIFEKTTFLNDNAKISPNTIYTVVTADAKTYGKTFYSKILDLTIKAGSFSRFKLDEKLDTHKFEEMYQIWVDALINDKNYRLIIAKTNDENIIGFLSYKIIEKEYKIDFMSIEEGYKKKGVGKALLQKTYVNINEKDFKSIITEIHAANIGAYNFFISHGFKVKEAFEIYHVHL
jgi:dTDP-4-amino-4,6-dideoxy-D-galactose acyltransferase